MNGALPRGKPDALDRSRNTTYAPAPSSVADQTNRRKRTYTEMRASHTGAASNNSKPLDHLPSSRNKKRLRRNADNTDEQAEESGMEDDAGGSSQDRYESDFINDDG